MNYMMTTLYYHLMRISSHVVDLILLMLSAKIILDVRLPYVDTYLDGVISFVHYLAIVATRLLT